jgi:hypothetical protein
MAVETLKSVGITNRDASPPVLNTAGRVGAAGRVFEVFDGIAIMPASASVGSTIRCVSVPSSAVVSSVKVHSGAQAAGAFDIGVYRNTRDGGAVVDADFFASAHSVAAAVLGVEVSEESTVYTIAKQKQPLWQAVGLTSDPGGELDIVATCATTAVTTGLAAYALRVQYKL